LAVLGRVLLGSSERLDLPDLLSIDSFVAADFKYLVQSMVGSNPFILKGFDVIQPQDSIGTQSISIRVADSVVWAPTEAAGSFFFGLEEGNAFALPLVPELRKNATNYVYVSFDTTDTARDSRAFWDPDQNGGEGGEFSQDVNTQTAMQVAVNVSVSGFPEDSIPVCIVQVGANVIESIEDARDLMFRLGTGGSNPDPFHNFQFPELPSAANARLEPSTTMTSSLDPNPFQGGDKNFTTLKEWMDVVMTKIKELSGTAYWYQGFPSTPSNKNIFLDALGSTLKSKGEWIHDSSIAGRVTWTEDIQWKSLLDPRTIVFRDNADPVVNLDIPEGNVGYFQLLREVDINGGNNTVDWVNGSDNVNGVVGAFENIAKGDWVRKISDTDDKYLRVEELYALPNQAGGTTTPALAQSIKLSGNYSGSTASELGVYTKGEFTAADLQITATNDPNLQVLGDSFFWFVYRSDTTLNNTSIIQTDLTLDITEADGQRAKIAETVLAGHGLNDGDRITIMAGAYAGTYQVSVENTTEAFIETAVTGDELGVQALYAIITTGSVQSDDGFDEESERHRFEPDQWITVADTATGYDGAHLINVRSDTELQIPIGAVIGPVGATGTTSLPRVNVRTEFGVVKVVQGESIDIGDPDSTNILSFIGMDSLAQTKPVYNTPPGYNALDGHSNYNTNPTDDLTERAAKLTAMMADRVQERGMSVVGSVNISHQTNAANQDISANGNIVIKKPSSPDQTVDLTVSLPANSVAVATIDRNGSSAISLTVESLGSQYLLEENKIIMFYRYGDTTVYNWEGVALAPNQHYNRENPEESGNRNISLWNPGRAKFNHNTGLITLLMETCAETSIVTTLAAAATAQSSSFIINSTNDATSYHVWFNLDGGGADPGDTANPIPVTITTGQTDADVATAIASAININAGVDFTATPNSSIVTIVNTSTGEATDIADGGTPTGFTLETRFNGSDPDIEIQIPGSANNNIIDVSVINGLGTLIVPAGSAVWCRVNRYAQRTFDTIQLADAYEAASTIADTGSLFITPITDVPTDQDVFVLWLRNGDNLLEMHKATPPDDNIYEEQIKIVSGAPANDNEATGPIAINEEMVIPADSRDDDNPQKYVVGALQLLVYLNGQKLRVGLDYNEVGSAGCESSRIELLLPLSVGDELLFRIDSSGSVYFSSAGAGVDTLQEAYDGGRFISVAAGQPIVLSGSPLEKLMVIQGHLDVEGVIDPTALQLTPSASTPLTGINAGAGIWVLDTDDRLRYDGGFVDSVGYYLRGAGGSGGVDEGRIAPVATGIEIETQVVGGIVDLLNDIRVTGNSDLNGTLDVSGQVDLSAAGVATNVRGTLTVTEATTLNALLTVNADSDFNGQLDVSGQVDLAAAGVATNIRGALDVVEATTLTTLDTTGQTDLAGAGVATNVRGSLDVVEATTLTTLDTTGQTDLAGAGVATNVRGTLIVTEGTTLNSLLTVNANSDLNGTLDVSGQVDLAATLVPTNIRGTLDVAEDAVFQQALQVLGSADFGELLTENLDITGDNAILRIGKYSGAPKSTSAEMRLHPIAGGTASIADYIGHRADANITTTTMYVWPDDTATAGFVLISDAAGNLSWSRESLATRTMVSEYTNNTGSTIPAGTIVIVSATADDEIIVADASAIATSEGTVGVVQADILDGASGLVVTSGKTQVDGTYTRGQRVYLSDTLSGQGQTAAPTATNSVVMVIGIATSSTTVELNIYQEYVNE
jgi:hypothetical protein